MYPETFYDLYNSFIVISIVFYVCVYGVVNSFNFCSLNSNVCKIIMGCSLNSNFCKIIMGCSLNSSFCKIIMD